VSKTLRVTIDDALWKEMEKRAAYEVRTIPDFVRYALMAYLRRSSKKKAQPLETEDGLSRDEQLSNICRELHEKRNHGYVYFLTANINGIKYCKIGKTKSLQKRMKTYPLKVPFETHLFIVFEVRNMTKVEHLFHLRFLGKRREGEWFELLESDYRDIEREQLGLIRYERSLIRAVNELR